MHACFFYHTERKVEKWQESNAAIIKEQSFPKFPIQKVTQIFINIYLNDFIFENGIFINECSNAGSEISKFGIV